MFKSGVYSVFYRFLVGSWDRWEQSNTPHLPPRPRPPWTQLRPLRNPSQEQQGPHGPRRTRPPPYPHRRTSERMRALTTSSILCTPSAHSFTGTSVRVWRRASSPRAVRTLLLLRRITKRSEPSPWRARARRKVRNIRLFPSIPRSNQKTLKNQINTKLEHQLKLNSPVNSSSLV